MKNTFFKLTAFLWIGLISFGSCGTKGTEKTDTSSRKRKVLVGLEFTSIKVTSLPRFNPNGEKWDPFAPFAEEPDVLITFSQFDQFIYKSEIKEDCKFDGELKYIKGLPISIKTYTDPILIEVFDDDGISSNDNMAYFKVLPLEFEKKHEIKLSNSEGTMKLEIGIRWLYEER